MEKKISVVCHPIEKEILALKSKFVFSKKIAPVCKGRQLEIRVIIRGGVFMDTYLFYSLLKYAVSELAESHFRNGSPVLAACCHLAVDDTQVCQLFCESYNYIALSLGLCQGKQ